MTSPIPAVPEASAVPPASAVPAASAVPPPPAVSPFPATPPASAVPPVSPAAPGTRALRDAEDAPVATDASVTLVASDLDRTLIYSSAALGLRMPDAEAPRLLCVEVYEHKPLSHLTETAASLLDELARTTVFVPTTTRTREQYGRIRLPGPAPRFAICANGGHLLVDGESDPDWRTHVSRRLATESASLAEVRARLLASADPAWLLKERVAEDLFAYLVVERSALPDGWVEELGEWAGARGWTVSLQGRKIYAVPAPLTKSAAMREVARRTGATLTLAAGDSLLDADLLLAADHAWRPAHGELAEFGWSAPHVRATAEDGVAAGEEILRQLLRASRPDAPGRHHP